MVAVTAHVKYLPIFDSLSTSYWYCLKGEIKVRYFLLAFAQDK